MEKHTVCCRRLSIIPLPAEESQAMMRGEQGWTLERAARKQLCCAASARDRRSTPALHSL